MTDEEAQSQIRMHGVGGPISLILATIILHFVLGGCRIEELTTKC